MAGNICLLEQSTQTAGNTCTVCEANQERDKIVETLDSSVVKVEAAVRDSKSECVASAQAFLKEALEKLELAVTESNSVCMSAIQTVLDNIISVNEVTNDEISFVEHDGERKRKEDNISDFEGEKNKNISLYDKVKSMQVFLDASLCNVQWTITELKSACQQTIQQIVDSTLENINVAVLELKMKMTERLKSSFVDRMEAENSLKTVIGELKMANVDWMQNILHRSLWNVELAVQNSLQANNDVMKSVMHSLKTAESSMSGEMRQLKSSVLEELKTEVVVPAQIALHTLMIKNRVGMKYDSSEAAIKKQNV